MIEDRGVARGLCYLTALFGVALIATAYGASTTGNDCLPVSTLETPSGATIATVEIVDAGGVIWTLAGSQVARNGVIDLNTRSAIKLAYVNHIVYHENYQHMWYGWKNNTWVYQSVAPVGVTN